MLRRIIRRAVRYAYLLGTEKLVMPSLVETAIDVMGNAYPDVSKNRDFIVGVLTREEERFRQTLKTGLSILEDELGDDPSELPGSTAFLLHDTYGFPLELTEEIAGERGVAVDIAGFDTEMRAQRERAKAARKGNATDDDRLDAYREIVEQFGITEFLGYTDDITESRLLAVGAQRRRHGRDLPRPHAVLRRERRPGRRHRHHHDPPTAGSPRCSTPRSPCRACAVTRRGSSAAPCMPVRR